MNIFKALKLKYDLWCFDRRIKKVTQWGQKLSPKKRKYAKEIIKRLDWLKEMRRELK